MNEKKIYVHLPFVNIANRDFFFLSKSKQKVVLSSKNIN